MSKTQITLVVVLISLVFAQLIQSQKLLDFSTQKDFKPTWETTKPVHISSDVEKRNDFELTDEFVVRIESGVEPETIASEYGLTFEKCLKFSKNLCVFTQPSTEKREEHQRIKDLRSHPGVHWIERQTKRLFTKFSETSHLEREMPDLSKNPLYKDQWHLHNEFIRYRGEDINVLPIWEEGYSGKGVLIGIVDDSVEHSHPDLKKNYVADASYDFNGKDNDPSPVYKSDKHGTAVAGVAAAGNNGYCGVGSAFNANFSGLRLISDPSTDKQVAEALTYHDDIDIYSNSWGYSVAFVGPMSKVLLEAFTYGVTEGRNGKGAIYSWAAGNDRTSLNNANYDPFNVATESISVAAVDHQGIYSWYSNPGCALLISAPSNGNIMGITTTDRTGKDGYSSTDCDDEFGGTSSACPLVSGCIALMLEVNPNLGWRDVQHIIAVTARKNNPSNTDWAVNGYGLNVNHNYGFGVIDVSAAAEMAKTWVNLPERKTSTFKYSQKKSIPEGTSNPLVVKYNVDQDISLEHVQVSLDLTHSKISTLTIVLQSPNGTKSRLLELYAPISSSYLTWTFLTNFNWGESSKGEWTLTITDNSVDNRKGQLNYANLIIFGHDGVRVSIISDTASYCISKSVELSWETTSASSIKVTSADGSYDKSHTVTGMSSITLKDLASGTYNALLYSTSNDLIGSTNFELPDCSEPTISVSVNSCNEILVYWTGASTNTSILLKERNYAAVISISTNVQQSGEIKTTRPYVGKWHAELVKADGSSLASSDEFNGDVCVDPVIVVNDDSQCSKNKITITASNTQIGMQLSAGQSIESPVFSISDSTPTNESLILEFSRTQPYGQWTTLVSYASIPITSQTFTMNSCLESSVSYDLGSNTCDNNGLGIVTVSWTGAPEGSWVGLWKEGSKYYNPWDNTLSESGSIVFKDLKRAKYLAVLGDADDTILDQTELFLLDCQTPTDPIKPPVLKLKKATSEKIKIKIKPKGDVDAEFFQLRISVDERKWLESITFSQDVVKIVGVSSDTKYYFQGRSGMGQNTWSDWSETLVVKTEKET